MFGVGAGGTEIEAGQPGWVLLGTDQAIEPGIFLGKTTYLKLKQRLKNGGPPVPHFKKDPYTFQ